MLVIVHFFFKEPATTENSTYCHPFSLHDALPIEPAWRWPIRNPSLGAAAHALRECLAGRPDLVRVGSRSQPRPEWATARTHAGVMPEDVLRRAGKIGRAHV